ncbi:MAG: ion channel [Verrucomicrobiaceae bacterium]
MKKSNTPIPVRMGQTEFLKINATRWEWRDLYHLVLSLRWSGFILLVLGFYLAVNLVFAAAYYFGGDCIAEMPRDSFGDAFFFSIETLATVGYGHMHPATTYGHIVVSIEIIAGMFWMAVMTGLIFVRFSRPTARVLFSKVMVIAPFDGKPTLMIRVANGRHQSMVETSFHIMIHRDELVAEGTEERRFYSLKLTFDHLIMFPASITLRHVIDETSPLYGATLESLRANDTRFMASVVGVDTVIPAPMQSQQDYTAKDVRFGEKFVDVYATGPDGRYTVDYARLHETEPAT